MLRKKRIPFCCKPVDFPDLAVIACCDGAWRVDRRDTRTGERPVTSCQRWPSVVINNTLLVFVAAVAPKGETGKTASVCKPTKASFVFLSAG